MFFALNAGMDRDGRWCVARSGLAKTTVELRSTGQPRAAVPTGLWRFLAQDAIEDRDQE
jgi:hypothetical protein